MVLIVTIITLIPFNSLDLSISNSFLEKCFQLIRYKIIIPIYLVILLLIITLLYLKRIKQRYDAARINFAFIVGKWRNEFIGNDLQGSENIEITNDGKYLIDGFYTFNIDNFNYIASQNKITFTKVGVQLDDHRKLFNHLTINNNELMTGTEDAFDNKFNVKYTKLN